MKIQFWKMHGASNDFILVDDRKLKFPAKDRKWLESIASPKTGVGCEGIILIQPSKKADFRMRFFNPDGGEVEMCGNGARCVAKLAYDIKAAPAKMTIDTVAGLLSAKVMGDNVCLWLTTPKDWRLGRTFKAAGRTLKYGFVNSGVPHCVVEVKDLDKCDIQTLGAATRYHKEFAPAGTNANFISITGPGAIRVRTYERGVEAETKACGTGITASALVAAKMGKVKPPVKVQAASGDVLTVDFRLTDEGAENVTLLGPAVHVFQGVLEY